MTSALALTVDASASYRLTRLITEDRITRPFRERVIRRAYVKDPDRNVALPDEPWVIDQAGPDAWHQVMWADGDPPALATLITCRWCTGMYVAAAVVAASTLVPRAWRPVSRALALSAYAALLARLEDE